MIIHRPSDVVIGLDVGSTSIRAGAFTPSGIELGLADQPVRPDPASSGLVELDALDVWQTAVEVVRRLAGQVPDLGRRTIALGVTGEPGGLCLIDEDGEPVGALITTATCAAGPEAAAAARETGRLLDRLIGRAAHELDRAAYAVGLHGWVLACLTGRALDLPSAPRSGPASARAGHDEHDRLRPPAAALREAFPLVAAGAGATGLWEDTPVVVSPPAPIAAALAAGMEWGHFDGAVALLESDAWLVRRAQESDADRAAPWPGLPPLQVHTAGVGGAALDWLGDLAQGLLADAGLIGLSIADLRALLDRQAEAAAPARLRLRPSSDGAPGPWILEGLGASSSFADLARAAYEAVGTACRDGLAAGGGPPPEVRITGRLALTGPGRTILPALLAAPSRRLERALPAATGAALWALHGTGGIDRLNEGGGPWIEPYLGPVRAPHAAEPPRAG